MAATAHVKVVSLDSVDFARYGQVIKIPEKETRRPDFQSDVLRFYGSLGLFDSNAPMEFGICIYRKRAFETEQLEQHLRTQELLYAIDGDFIMPVAPNTVRGTQNAPDLDNLVAVRVRRGEGVLFHPKVWHWVPYPFKKESFALVGFAKGTAGEDLLVSDLGMKVRMKAR